MILRASLLGSFTRSVFLASAMVALGLNSGPASAIDLFWDTDADAASNNLDGTNLGGAGSWDTTTANWWDGASMVAWPNHGTANAIFTYAFPDAPLPYAIPTPFTVTVDGGGVTANRLTFQRSGYTLSGGAITLAGADAGLHANLGESATISSQISGSGGLVKTGGGSIRLANAANDYTGTTTIANGTLIISSAGALGGTGTVSILTNNNTPLNANLLGFAGGSLVLDGTAGGFTFARDIDFEGRGPIGDRGAAILSLGNNTLSGTLSSAVSPLPLSPTASFRNSRINSVNGTLNLSGTLNVGGTAGTTITMLGGINSTGVGNFDLSGLLSGTGTLEKSGAGTLFLNPSDSSGFSGRIRVSASAAGGQSSVRVTSALDGLNANSVFGTVNGAGASAPIDLNGGVLEIRIDGSSNFGTNVYTRSTGNIFTGPAPGGQGVNGTVTLGTLQQNASGTAATNTTTLNSRNGYGVTFSTLTSDASTSTSLITTTITNNMGGNLTFTGNVTMPEGSTASRPRALAIGGVGNTVIQGSVIAGTDPGKTLTKSGAGSLTIRGVGTTVAGGISINGGAIIATDFRSLNNNAGTVNIGTTTTAGSLIIGTDVTPTAAGLTTSKIINLAGTTGGANIYANQGGTNPVIFNANFVSTGVGAKTLTLGGTSPVDNIINGVIPNAAQGFTPNAALSSGGTVINFASTAGMAVGQFVAGTGIQVGTTISAITATSITLSLPTTADRAATDVVNASTGGGAAVGLTKIGSGTWVLNAASTYTGATTIQNGTLKLRATGAASNVIGEAASNTIVFSANTITGTAGGTLEFRGFLNEATTETLGALTPTAGPATIRLLGNGAAANLTFTSLGATAAASSVNFITAGAAGGVVTLTGQAATTATNLPGTTNFQGHLYINGADFATINASAQVVAPTYGAAGNFREAATALTAAHHNKLTGSFTMGANTTVSSLVTNSETLTMGGNLTVSTGGILQSGGTATFQSNDATPRTIVGGAAATNIAIRVDGSGDVLNLGAPGALVGIASTTTGGLTKNGAGTLVLFGTNAQTGAFTINEGTIRLSGVDARMAAAAGVATVVRQNAFLEFDTATVFAANPTVANLDGAGTIRNIGSADVTFVQTGAGTWAGNFTQTGDGVLNVSKLGTTGAPIWQGLSNYTGVTTIGGTTGSVTVDFLADIGEDSGIGRGNAADDATNAASLVFAATGATPGGITYRGSNIEGALTFGSRSASTNRLFTLSGTGATLTSNAINSNAIVWSNFGNIVHGTNANRTLFLAGTSTGDNTFNPRLTDSAGFVTSLTKQGTGQWNLGNSANTYTGTTRIENGILALNHNGAIHADSPVVLAPTSATSAAILQMSGTFERNLSATPTAGTGSMSWAGTIASTTGGAGFAAHSGPLTVAIGGIAAPTALTWGSGGFVGTSFVQNLVLGSTTALSHVDFRNAIDLNPGAASSPEVTTNSTTTVTTASTAGLVIGQAISGAGIPAGAFITGIVDGTTFTISAAATASATVTASILPAVRTVSVLDNVNTGADYAILSGVLSGAGGSLRKIGAGSLRLTGANTYTGLTAVEAGALVVTSLGSSTGPATSSVGASGVAMGNDNAIVLGNLTTTGGILQYVGPGEVSDRKIRLQGTTANNQIHADGSGPLILTNVAHDTTATGNKTLSLRGSNTAGNMITSKLSNNGAGVLTVTVDGGATWILTNAGNDYTGVTNVNAGALGIGHDSAIGAALTINNGNVFAYGGDRALTNALNLVTNTTNGWLGDYSLTFNGTNSLTGTGTSSLAVNTHNSIVSGKALTFNGMTSGAGANRTWTFDGPGRTVINGNFTSSTTFGVALTKNGNGTLVLGTNGATSDWNKNSASITLNRGTLAFSADEAIPTASAANGGLIINPAAAIASTAILDLNGTTQTVNALTATTDGTVVIDNTSATAATFRFGANNSAVSFGAGVGSYTIQNSGGGALSLVKLGNTTATFISGMTLAHSGVTASEGGGVFTIASPVTATTGLRAIESSTLALTGGLPNGHLVTSIEVGAGSTLSLLDGAGSALSNLTSLNLGGSGSGTVTLNLNVGDLNTTTDRLNTDTLTLVAGYSATLGNSVTFNLTDAGLNPNQTYTLLNLIDGGIDLFGIGNMIQGATPGGFDSMTWFVDDKLVQLTTGNLLLNDLYWRGSTDNTWNANPNNWSLNKDGTGLPDSIPGQGNKVIFAYDGIGAGALTTTLEQNFKINSLVFEAGATTPASITINPGALATARLEVAPSSAANGIAIAAGGPASVTISAPFKIGANQTWNVADAVDLTGATFATASSAITVADTTGLQPGMLVVGAGIPAGATVASVTNGTSFVLSTNTTAAGSNVGLAASSTLTLSGALFGEANVTKSGAGKVILTAAADPTFNAGQTATFTVTGGNLEFTNIGALGTTANSNVASIVVSGGGFYYNNATAGTALTLPHSITLSGGALSGGGANHTYGSTISVTAASTINLADSNGPTTNAARSITLAGGLSGSGNLTLTGNGAVSAGNQIAGTLTLNQDNSAWTGDWNILRGTVATNNPNGLGGGTMITMEKGRIQLTAGAGTPTIAQDIVIASATENAVGEFNLAAGIATTFSGQVTLGGAGGAGELRVLMANDAASSSLTGGVVLANNGGLSTQNAATRVLDVNSVISQTGGPRTLTINDSAWGGTAGTVRLSAANTYTGGTNLARGILQMNHVGALSTGPLTAVGASTFNSLVDLTGANALSNALNLNAVLTFTGDNGVTFSGTTANIGAGGITNSLTAGSLLFSQINLSDASASAARTLTLAGAGTGGTTITALLNNNFNNTLTNNIGAAAHTLTIGGIALSEDAGTGRTLTLGGTGSTTVTGVIENVVGGGGTAGSLTKAGNGTLQLDGANTYTGGTTLSAGRLRFGDKDAIGTGTLTVSGTSIVSATTPLTGVNAVGNALALSASLSFDGANSLELSGSANLGGAARTITANGDAGATLILSGAMSNLATADGSALVLAGNATGTGVISGGFTMTGTTADLTVSSGNWTFQGASSTVADDIIFSGTSTVVNLNATGVLAFGASADNYVSLRNGVTVNLGADDAIALSGWERLYIAQDGGGAKVTLNMNSFNLSTNRLILGERATDRNGDIIGTGTLTVVGGDIDLLEGTISANLASTGTLTFEKFGFGTVTLAGDNSGLASTGVTIVNEGTLVLDYTNNNATKLRAASQLDMRGARLEILGNSSAATLQTVASFTMATGAGNNIIDVTAGTGQTATLALGAITRAASAGTLRINLNNAGAAVTTSTGNTNGLVGSAAHTTVRDGTGTWFGTNSSGSIVALASAAKNDVATWLSGEHLTDEASGFVGTVSANHLSSLRFDAAGGSALNFAPGGVLTIASGGILVTDLITSGSPGLFGGTLGTGVTEIIVTQDSSQTFEISSRLGVNNAFTKTGPGTVLLSGNNAYTGQTSIQNGVLQIGGGNAIGDSSLVTLATNRNSTLRLLADETIGRLQGGQRATNSDYGIVDIGAHTLRLNHSGGNTSYAGRFVGTGTLAMNAGSVSNLNHTGISTGFTGDVLVNGGLFQLSGAGRIDAASFTVTRGSLLIDNNGTTGIGTRILDTAPITLHSADGAWGGEVRPAGLAIRRNDQNSAGTETVGVLSIASGASYGRFDASGTGSGTSTVAALIVQDIVRTDGATFNLRGTNLGANSARRTQLRIGNAANQTAFINAMVGGGGAAGSATISIVPWAMGQNVGDNAIVGDANMGNSLVTFISGNQGLRPLDFATEYATYAASGDTNNTREVRTTDLTGLDGRALNSLVIHNDNTAASSFSVTGSGAGETLTNTSGAFLFTLNPTAAASSAHTVTLGGFGDGIATPSGEYVFFVVNPSAIATTATLAAQIDSALVSAADLTKSGRGTLILTGNNTAGGGANKTTLNEGVLEIGSLANIGGSTGGLVFAGGTLRLGVGFADDLSSRTISFLAGGGTLDTNGEDLTLDGSLGSGVGGFTKTGNGVLTLNAGATYTGNTVLNLGTVTVGANNALGNGGNLTLAAGTTLALGTNTLTHGLVTTSGASPQITGNGTLSAAGGFNFNHTGDTTIDAVLAGAGGLLKLQANVLTLAGLSSYTGATEVRAGGLSFNSIGSVGGGASALGNPGNVQDGIIRMGLTTAATTLTYTGSGHLSDRLIGMQGTTGPLSVFGNGTGAVGFGGVRFETPGNKTLTLRGESDAALVNQIGGLTEVGGLLTLTKTDANTWAVTGVSNHTGTTNVQNGILRFTADKVSTAGALVLGTATTVGTLELTTGSANFTTMTAVTNSTTLENRVIIGAGQTLALSGNVTIGANAAASTTLFAASGDGSFVQTNPGGTFQVGAATGGTNVNAATADFGGLATFTVDLGATGTMRIGDNSSVTGGAAGTSTLILGADSTITANLLQVASTQTDSLQTLRLGSGTNLLNVNTLTVGGVLRSDGLVNFASATGTVQLRAADGTSRAAVNLAAHTGNTANNNTATLDLSGHDADLLVNNLNVADRTLGTGFATATLSFDEGTLDVTNLVLARRTGTGTGNATATLNLGGGTVLLGSVTMAVNTSAGGEVEAHLNVTGGTVTFGTGSGTAIHMANAAADRTATSNLNLTGGTVTVTGNIVRQGGAGTENATVTLDGATLDLSGNSIGTGAAPIVLTAQSGILRNLAELNGGGNLVKTGAGTLVLEGANTYTGRTVVNGGVLSIDAEARLGLAPAAPAADHLEIDGGALRATASFALDDANRGITIGSSGGILDIDAGATLSIENAVVLGGELEKTGAGTLLWNGNSSGAGPVKISAGTLGGSGTVAAATAVEPGAFLAAGTGGAVGTLSFAEDLTTASGSTWLIDIVQDQNGISDLISVGGALSLGGATLSLNQIGVNPFTPNTNFVWTIATFNQAAGLTGTFAGLDEGATVSDNFIISYGVHTAGAITLTAVPEPGTLGLLGLGLGGLLARRLRRRRGASEDEAEDAPNAK